METTHTRLLAPRSVKFYLMNEARLVVERPAAQIYCGSSKMWVIITIEVVPYGGLINFRQQQVLTPRVTAVIHFRDKWPRDALKTRWMQMDAFECV